MSIYVHSRYGEGATFVVELPVVPFKATPLKEETFPSDAKAGSILILDDEEAILNLSKEVLSSLGYIVDAVGDGIAALEKIKEKSYDLIISDIKMPNMDGKKFYEEVRKIKPHLAGRIVFTTGDIMSRDTNKFLEDIKNLRLEKPFTIQELKGVIAKQLRIEKR